MKTIFEYTDYRDFLREHYEQKKNLKPYYSYRFISNRVGINPGFIAKLFNGKIHISLKKAPVFVDLLRLKGKEKDYFLELIRFSKAKRDNEIKESFKRLQSIKGIEFNTLADNQLEFFDKWYHMALRSLLSIYPFNGKNFKKLGSLLNPSISVNEVKESLKLLKRLELIKFNKEKDTYEVLGNSITTDEKWTSLSINNYQNVTLQLSKQALENIPKKHRDISTVTFTCSSNQIDSIKQRLNELREEMLLLTEDCKNENRVMHLNLQLFPSAIIPEDNQ